MGLREASEMWGERGKTQRKTEAGGKVTGVEGQLPAEATHINRDKVF